MELFHSQNRNEEEEEQKDQYLIFNIGTDFYGIDIKEVTEIIGMQKITQVPEMPDYVKGIISLRGKIIPAIDVRVRFKMEPVPYNDRTCIIIVDMDAITVGLIVDGVSDVLALGKDDIAVPPEVQNDKDKSRFLKGIGKVGGEVRLILDCGKILNDNILTNIVCKE